MRSLERRPAVIRALSLSAPGLTITEVAEATVLTRAAARPSVLTGPPPAVADAWEGRA